MAAVTGQRENLKQVVAVEYPRRGCYVIGFLTSEALEKVAKEGDAEGKWVNIFVPTTPNPTSGFLIMVPESDVVPLRMSADEAFKLLISGGLVQERAGS